MIYECEDRRGKFHRFNLSDELTAEQAMERLGVLKRPFRVRRYPNHRPDQARTVQEFEVH